jgi:hypothetical protein
MNNGQEEKKGFVPSKPSKTTSQNTQSGSTSQAPQSGNASQATQSDNNPSNTPKKHDK